MGVKCTGILAWSMVHNSKSLARVGRPGYGMLGVYNRKDRLLPRCLSTSVALSLTPSRPLFRQPSPPSCSTPFQSHPHAPPTRPCDKRMSFSLADLVTTHSLDHPSSLPTPDKPSQPPSHSAIPVSHCLILLVPIHPIPSTHRSLAKFPLPAAIGMTSTS